MALLAATQVTQLFRGQSIRSFRPHISRRAVCVYPRDGCCESLENARVTSALSAKERARIGPYPNTRENILLYARECMDKIWIPDGILDLLMVVTGIY